MSALRWTTAEVGAAPAAPPAGQAPALAIAGPEPYVATPGASVRHVLRALASEPAVARDRHRWLARVRPLVDREHAMLRARFEADGSVEALLRGRARLADGVVIGLLHLARWASEGRDLVTPIAPVTVLAVGGYGRRELAPASDLDLLFLLAESPARHEYAQRMIGAVLAGLWDLGFEVGHATRSLSQCRQLAGTEPTVLSSLLDARFVAGSLSLHAMLDAYVRRMADEIGPGSLADTVAAELSANGGKVVGHSDDEPNVKRGPGALRDLQRLLWLVRLRQRGAKADTQGRFDRSQSDMPPKLVEARRFLWLVRAHLHLLAGRAQDRLVREMQPAVAQRVGLPSNASGGGVARLLGAYHEHTHHVCALSRAL
jgi:[protein-PII] uridylyltransferase